MKQPISRRMFLRGAGGAALAIPFLPSLVSRAFAQEAPAVVGPRFLFMRTGHGDVWGANMYPSDALLTQSVEYAGRTVRYGALPTRPADQETAVTWSPVCRAPAEVLNPSVCSKMNILRGIDVPFAIGHQGGVNLGNVAHSGGVPSHLRPSYGMPTIDQTLAYAPSFYSEQSLSSRVLRRSFHINGGLSFGYSQASTRSGKVIGTQAFTSSRLLYEYLFDGAKSLAGWNNTMLNRVFSDYQRMMNHPRISAADRIRLEQHIARMADLERLLRVSEALGADLPEPPGNGDAHAYHRNGQLRFAQSYIDAYIHVIVSAFTTGVSRVGAWNNGGTFFTDPALSLAKPKGQWHAEVGHGGLGAERAQAYAVVYNQGTFQHVFAKLAKALDDVQMADGLTALDHSLLVFGQEHGQITHHTQGCRAFPLVTAGLAGGRVAGGHYIDFSNQQDQTYDATSISMAKPGMQSEYAGLHYNQFLANCMLAMGVPQREWPVGKLVTEVGPTRSPRVSGYGHLVSGGRAYADAERVMNEPLPVFARPS